MIAVNTWEEAACDFYRKFVAEMIYNKFAEATFTFLFPVTCNYSRVLVQQKQSCITRIRSCGTKAVSFQQKSSYLL